MLAKADIDDVGPTGRVVTLEALINVKTSRTSSTADACSSNLNAQGQFEPGDDGWAHELLSLGIVHVGPGGVHRIGIIAASPPPVARPNAW